MPDQLGLKQNTIATYEIEKTTPSERTLLDICRVFHVNEDWLRTGQGDMLLTPPSGHTPDEELMGFLGDVAAGMTSALASFPLCPGSARKTGRCWSGWPGDLSDPKA